MEFGENGNDSQRTAYNRDARCGEFSVTNLDLFWTVVSIIMRLVNVILNVVLAVEYYQKEEINHFVWTTFCIVVPMVVTTLLSINMYLEDRKKSYRKRYNSCEMVVFVVILPFLFRYFQSLMYAIASRNAEKKGDIINQRRYFKSMIKEESDVALIRIFECFLEAAPQKVLQLSIILSEGYTFTWIQFAAISGCVCSLAWSMVVYHKYNRYSQADKEQISILGCIGQCCWHFSIAVSRMLCMSLIASIFPLWTLIASSSRVLLTSIILIIFDKPTYCSATLIHSFGLCLILGIVYIFAYILPKEGRTRYRFTIYYVVCILENIVCIALSIRYTKSSITSNTFFVLLCAFSVAMYLIGVIFMILYYTTCHPHITARPSRIITSTSPNKS